MKHVSMPRSRQPHPLVLWTVRTVLLLAFIAAATAPMVLVWKAVS